MYAAKILADSINPVGNRLTTFEITYPRFVHSELMTHRMLSRNAASSRAIPVSKMISNVVLNPATPVWWGKAQSGMQASEEVDDLAKATARNLWFRARDDAVETATALAALGMHKQIVNRLLEPWMWITVIASATDWNHFFNLRVHPDAQPEIRKIASMMLDLYTDLTTIPKFKYPDEWHLPLWFPDDEIILQKESLDHPHYRPLVSAGRCARVSYLTHDGKRDLVADWLLAEKLASSRPMHASPLEHPAKALDDSERIGNYAGWQQLRKSYKNEYSNDLDGRNASQ